jgi:RNA polymerase sigma factor (sigma-70 family)
VARGHSVHEIDWSFLVLSAADEDRDAVAHFLRERSERTFARLYARHTPAMLGLATRLLQRSRSDAEDAVQEAWLRAVAALPRFAWHSQLRTWLCGFVVNCCREVSRRRAGDAAAVSIGEAPSLVLRAEGGSPPPDPRVDVERAIALLPPAAREVFILHEIYGYTHEEIGEIAGIDAGTSKSQLHHARQRFRAYFEATDGKRTERA